MLISGAWDDIIHQEAEHAQLLGMLKNIISAKLNLGALVNIFLPCIEYEVNKSFIC